MLLSKKIRYGCASVATILTDQFRFVLQLVLLERDFSTSRIGVVLRLYAPDTS